MEDIRTRDEGGNIVARGDRVSLNGQHIGNGPPTTLSGTGIDRMAFLQANLTRDNTRFVNGAIVGERDVFQVCLFQALFSFYVSHKSFSVSFKKEICIIVCNILALQKFSALFL